jgi:SAM-dependent methyltransferase
MAHDFAHPPIQTDALQRSLARHLALYRRKPPHYQTRMLNGLLRLWTGPHESLLDLGGGTGVIAQAISEFFPVGHVQSIDVVDRFCSTLSIATQRYDGATLPFDDGAFEAATLNNVLHHVPPHVRIDLMREVRRVVRGPVYIKDHESGGRLDDLRLLVLDAIGNTPFGGMISARYLSRSEWAALARAAGYVIGAETRDRYRAPLMALLFPNRLEVSFRFDPV